MNIKKPGDRCVSPIRAGATNKTSFVVYEDFWYDFSAAQGGDIIDFCALYSHNGDRGAAIRELAKFTGVSDENPPSQEWINYTQNLNNRIAKWHKQLTEADMDYLHKRRINDETISRYMIGRTDNGRLSIPYFKNGYVAYYITRYMDGGSHPDRKYMKMEKDGLCENIPFGMETLDKDSETLVIAEGSFDVLSFIQEGYACLSAMTGHFSKEQLPLVLSAARNYKRVFLVFDNDIISKAGEKFTIKMAKILMSHRIPFIVGQVPPSYKDVSEYYADGGELQTLIDSAEDGIMFLGKNIKNQQEFEQFSRRACRFMQKTDVVKFFTNALMGRIFDKEWLETLKKDCTSAPSEDYIAKQILDKYTLLYNPRIGFFQYNGKYWERLADEVVQRYISEELGVYRTGSKLTSILKIVKSDSATDKLFNVAPIMNFINGTLELEPEIRFREHSKDDLCTYVLDYPYEADAKAPKWEKFITEVTDCDDKKVSLLQESAGYVLYTDNRLQKCFVLIGEGANGKSVFLNVLSRVFGKDNISTVEMSSLAKEFQAIHLMSTMLNISAETRSDVTGAESIFKQIVAGDSISSCYKGKDYITFVPRAKMFLSCNEYMKSKDTTDGWLRRFCFINFPVKFVESPKEDNERLIDKDIEDKLLTELPGIFNWVLSGYQQLKATGYFTEPADGKRIQEEFKESINPLIIFVKEYNLPAPTYRITTKDLYRDYNDWCLEAGHSAMSRTTFSGKIGKIAKEYRKDWETFNSGGRGYKRVEEKQTEMFKEDE